MMDFHYPYGATSLDPDEIEDLIPDHITTHALLNEWEQENILTAVNFYTQRKFSYLEILDAAFIKSVHEKMFDKTWLWAGNFRKTEKSIGVDPLKIIVDLKILLDDIRYHVESDTYSIDETAARFHHRLVSIHLFPNGNGRHARFITDLFLNSRDQPEFAWGAQLKSEMPNDIIRKKYIKALRAADKHDYRLLFKFVR